MDFSSNPLLPPLEELKIKFTSQENGYDQYISALDEKWCNKGYMYTLYASPPSKSADGEFPMGSKEDWLERMIFLSTDMNRILQLEYHRFWSEVAYNKQFLDGINTFLQNAPPFYMIDQLPEDKDVLKMFRNVQRLVFKVLTRLTSTRESEESWMKPSTLGKILYDNFVISFPQLMEISLIYVNDNFKEVSALINRVLKIQPKYMNDIKKSSAFMCEVFTNIELQLDARHEPSTLSKLVYLMLDISYSLDTFIKVCPQAAAVYHQHLLEPRIATFYENTVPLLIKFLDSQNGSGDFQEEHAKFKMKIDISRHNLITSVHGCLSSHLATLLEERDHLTDEELKIKVDMYMSTLTDCLSEHTFIRDYNSAFPIHGELSMLSEICPEIDSLKLDFIVESVALLFEPPKRRKRSSATASNGVNPSSSNSFHSLEGSKQEARSGSTKKKVVGVELESLITEVKDILTELGDGFVAQCLEYYNYVSADVINAVLEENLPECLLMLERDLPLIPPDEAEATNVYERINAFDNDEFDIMTRDHVDTSRIHKGKRQEKHKDLVDMLNDKSHVREMRHVYQELSIVEDIVDYDDEYDDTYDDVDVAVGNDDTETAERRAFVVPRVLQQYKKVEEPQDYEEEEEPEKEKRDLFCEDPAELRARAEQRRQEARGRGRGRGGHTQHDVVGKAKGQGQEKEVVRNREFKNTNKSSRGNHNRRAMAAKKRRQGMFPS
ncbi:activating signal cointegrator 1 complex subunit 2 [Macrosteles quadrilineatus]|uniref:activating signal cointegrator 1 complex subunit 2 n=1 Tax=Macrosteles quadrilineatus TaxID=74068 RepID=UPI0023E33006|nr:activating signal cointegrator 1 complex subunit 2 [Macrosteles quadrilineatus]